MSERDAKMRQDERTNGIIFATDVNIHLALNGKCPPCHKGYPQRHEDCKKALKGLLHAEERIDMEAGFMSHYLYTRCDRCGEIGLIRPDSEGGP